jgi:ribosomal protein L13
LTVLAPQPATASTLTESTVSSTKRDGVRIDVSGVTQGPLAAVMASLVMKKSFQVV